MGPFVKESKRSQDMKICCLLFVALVASVNGIPQFDPNLIPQQIDPAAATTAQTQSPSFFSTITDSFTNLKDGVVGMFGNGIQSVKNIFSVSTPNLARQSLASVLPSFKLPSLPFISEKVAKRTIAYFDVTIDGISAGRILMELFDETAPRTVENFKVLANGAAGYGYRGSKFHRIIPGFMLQGGDFENGNGTGGYSIYGRTFEDETFKVPHNSSGLLSMANAGQDTNGSQFFITVERTPWLDNKHVVFGRVRDLDSFNIVKKIESYGTETGEPLAEIVIVDSGVLGPN